MENQLDLMAQQPWRFIKIEDWLCGGFAHTRGTYIILSQKHMDHLAKGWNEKMSPEEETAMLKNSGHCWYTNKCILYKGFTNQNLQGSLRSIGISNKPA